MSGAGAATVAFAKETSFRGSLDTGSDNTVDYFAFGRNAQLTDLSLERQLQRLRDATDAETTESIAGNIEGAVAVEAVISSDLQADVHDIVFNDGGTGFTNGAAPSATIYAGLDYLSGTAERSLEGCIPLEYSVNYEQGQPVSYTLSMGYADESFNTSITPSSITQPSDGSSAAFHGVTLDIDATTITKLQSASLSISGISRFQRGADPRPVDAVHANPQKSLSVEAIFDGPNLNELALGSPGATTTEARMSDVTATLDIAVSGTTTANYSLPKVKPNSYTWNQLISAEDTTESVQFNADGAITVS